MSLSAFLLGIAIVLNVGYLALAATAYGRMKPEHRINEVDRLLAFTLWWPFYDVYKREAGRLRLSGIVVLALAAVAYVASARLA